MTERAPKPSADGRGANIYEDNLRRSQRMQWLFPIGIVVFVIDTVNGFEQIIPNNNIPGSVISIFVAIASGAAAIKGFEHGEAIPENQKKLERQKQLAKFGPTSMITINPWKYKNPEIKSISVYNKTKKN